MRLSEFLRAQAHRLPGDVTVGWLVALIGPRVPGVLLAITALPSLLPVPGVGNITGGALMLAAVAIWHGQSSLAMPPRLAALRIAPPHASRLLIGLAALLDWVGNRLHPRWTALAGPRMWAWAAWPVAAMGLIIFLPIPLGNVLGTVALVALGLGHSVEDGVAVVVGWLLSGLTLLYSAVLTWGLSVWGQRLWEWSAARLAQ